MLEQKLRHRRSKERHKVLPVLKQMDKIADEKYDGHRSIFSRTKVRRKFEQLSFSSILIRR